MSRHCFIVMLDFFTSIAVSNVQEKHRKKVFLNVVFSAEIFKNCKDDELILLYVCLMQEYSIHKVFMNSQYSKQLQIYVMSDD